MWKVVPVNKSKAYRATNVNEVRIESMVRLAAGRDAIVGIDVGKFHMLAVVRWSDGEFERPWKVGSPGQISLFVEHLRTLSRSCAVATALESTGTYGDVLRRQLSQAGLPVLRVSGKAAKDYAEAFDGVPSQHDGKDAAVIAELAAFGKGRDWAHRTPSELDANLAYWVDWLDGQQRIRQFWLGRLEALLARHWPEVTRVLELSSITLLEALSHYGGPSALAADSAAAGRLSKWRRRGVHSPDVVNILASARTTIGLEQRSLDLKRVRQSASLALAAYREVQRATAQLAELASGNETLLRMGDAVGMATASVLWAVVGDPNDYSSGAAYRKAMGLNLKERSSGRFQGCLRISKRGPSMARRWMFFAALRLLQDPAVRPWYEAKKARDRGRGGGAAIAVTRKLALALHAVGTHGEPFDARKLFPGASKAKPKGPAPKRVEIAEAEIPY
jgi:transposase